MNRNQNRNRPYSGDRSISTGNNRTYQGNYRISNSNSYGDGYDDNYPSPTNYMNAGNMNMGKRNRFEDNIFRPDRDDEYYDGNDDYYDEDEDEREGLYGHNSGRNDYSYLDSRNREGHYGREDDDNYSRSSVYAGRNSRGNYTNESDNRRGKTSYENERGQQNSRNYNDMYDNSVAHNNGDYRYNNVGGGNNSRYNTFDDDRDYYEGYKEFSGDNRNEDRWRGRRIHR